MSVCNWHMVAYGFASLKMLPLTGDGHMVAYGFASLKMLPLTGDELQVDLSYNKLRGEIPNTFERLKKVKIMYLTGNFLTGSVNSLGQKLSSTSAFEPVSCTKSLDCNKRPPSYYSFHINCGGDRIIFGNTTYDGDSDVARSPAISKVIGPNWLISNTGHFLDTPFEYEYKTQNITRLSMNDDVAALYMNARVSPISLTYYGFCLENGHYTVKLHFAEIMFTDDNTYSSLGRRVFDVYIQGQRKLKDFNIAKEAKGVGKAIIKIFTSLVSDNTLEIRFSWAGKGSTGIPRRSVYGPLISAISVESSSSNNNHSMPVWAIATIAVASTSIIFIFIFGILWWKARLGNNNSFAKEFKDLDLKTGLFTLRQIKVATNNFNISNKIGEGGFGPVYKGVLWDGTMIAVKQLSSRSKQGNREFVNEIGMISALQHPCLVKLYGCCVERDQLLLVYEYMENNSLAHALFGPKESNLELNWPTSGYIAPEYAMHGYLTEKADIYSFGIVTLEIVSGVSNLVQQSKEEVLYLLDWAHLLKKEGNLMELVDPRLGSNFNEEEILVMIKVALLCTNVTSNLRPTMSSVLSMLEGRIVVPEFVSDASELMNEMKLEAMREYYNQIEESKMMDLSTKRPWVASSSSASDLYPPHLDSSYWETQKLRE
ncbi:hypothetical protein VNO77_28102 [Canavalia gladiata]|uniref:non-specific serine/threonine protein kinase n=1 Tax=Canavalia gladiata TaxID=3824 RepID=A0AAN9KY02_CANGL